MTPVLQSDAAWQRAIRRARSSVVLTLLMLTGLMLYLGWKEGYLRPMERFHVEAESSRLISPGMAVHLSGFKVGQVSGVELQADRKVRVELAIFTPYLEFIKADSEVVLGAGGLIEDASLEIVGGAATSPRAVPGAQLRFGRQANLSDQLGETIKRIEPIIAKVDALLAEAQEPGGAWQTTVRSLSRSTDRLDAWIPGFLERVDAALADIDRTGDLANGALLPLARPDGDLQAALRDIRATTEELRAELPPLLRDLRAVSASLRISASALESSAVEIAPRLPDLVDEGTRAAAGAGEVVDVVKDFGPIRGRLDDTAPLPLLPTSPP